jgi:hypothetical protein
MLMVMIMVVMLVMLLLVAMLLLVVPVVLMCKHVAQPQRKHQATTCQHPCIVQPSFLSEKLHDDVSRRTDRSYELMRLTAPWFALRPPRFDRVFESKARHRRFVGYTKGRRRHEVGGSHFVGKER